MKKLLLASAALVLSGGMAAAQGVTLGGDARMGVIYDGNDFFFSSRARVQFRLDGNTDTGLTFGARFRAHEAGEGSTRANGNTNMSGGEVFISGAFGRLSMGDVDSAAQAVTYNLPHVGYSELNTGAAPNQGRVNFLQSRPQTAALYTYSIDGFTAALGAGQLNSGRQNYSVGVRYTMDGFGAGLGYERGNAGTHIIASGTAAFDPVTVNAFYGRLSPVGGGARLNQYGASISASFDDITVIARAKRAFNGTRHAGIGAQYNLGGGASLRGGIARSSGTTIGDFGVVMSF